MKWTMPKMRDLAKWGIIAIAVIAVVAGFISVGGPQAARQTRQDATRLGDLNDIRSFVECVARATDQSVPESLEGQDICNWEVPFRDPYSDVPYGYEKLSDTAYRLCAGFENPQRMATRYALPMDIETGCITWTFQP
jgi:uncharacterized protein YjeT (DUF2065 family)